MTHPLLDNPKRIAKVDPANMAGLISRLGDQLSQSAAAVTEADWTHWSEREFKNIVLVGMGGSAIGGDLARAYLGDALRIPLSVIRNYRLPGYVSSDTLVFASSYSGNTEETLSAVEQARKRGSAVVAITSGGRLAEQATAHGWVTIGLPGGMPPRAALGRSFGALLNVLGRLRLVDGGVWDLQALSVFLNKADEQLNPDIPSEHNPAKKLALALHGMVPVVYGAAGVMAVVARRWKGQFCENAENLAFAGEVPEFNHNQIVGWGLPAGSKEHFVVVLLASADDHPRIAERFSITREVFSQKRVKVETVQATGDNKLQRIFSLIQLGDWASYYLAALNDVDPTAIAVLDYLKQKLAEKPYSG